MLDFENLRAFMRDTRNGSRMRIQDTMGNIAMISQGCPTIDGLIEHGIWFRIDDGEWMTRGDFEDIIAEWQDRRRKEFQNG